jgi:hypothetical protein
MENIEYDNPNIFQGDDNLTEYNKNPTETVSIRCPHCSHIGSFSLITSWVSYTKSIKGASRGRLAVVKAGIRKCPNTSCNGIVFTLAHGSREVLTLPPERIDFDSNGLPPKLLETLKEAISCHAAGAYRAAAMMVRRLLEEICDDSGAEGKDLHHRLTSLKTKITLPEELFDAMGELKALGNDAAHITAKNYTQIGEDESEDSIQLAKEILKSRYQLKGLVERLRARKANPTV